MPRNNFKTYVGLTAFLHIVENDGRLSCAHVSVLLALFNRWIMNGCVSPFPVSRSRIMGLSKIKSIATYHKIIKELEQFAYITYVPSYHPAIGSMVRVTYLS